MGRRLVAALAVPPLLALAGCADGGTTPAARETTVVAAALAPATAPLSLAAVSTAAAGSARTTVMLRTGTPGNALEVTGEGVVDFTARSARHVFRLPEELGGSTVEQLAVGGAVWVRMPTADGRYVELVGARLVADLLGLLPAADPAGQVAAICGAEAVRLVGRRDVGGVPTTRYEARLPLGALAESGPAGLRGQLAEALGEAGADTLTISVDVDGQGRLRRLAPALNGAEDDAGRGLWATVELHDFGVGVDLRPPAPDQVDPDFLGHLLDEAGTLLGDGTEGPGEETPAGEDDAVLPTVHEVREELGFLVDELLAE